MNTETLDQKNRKWLGRLAKGFLADAPALPLDIFRILVGGLFVVYFARQLADAGTWFGPEGLIDLSLVRRSFPAAWVNLFHPSLPLWVVYGIFGAAIVLSFGLALGVRPRLCAAAVFVVSVSGLRSLQLISTIDDHFMAGLAFWFILLPSGTTLCVKPRRATGDVLTATVSGVAFKLFLLNVALMHVTTGLWNLASEDWRAGLGLVAILRSPLAYGTGFAARAPLLVLEIGDYLVLAAELLLPFLLALPKNRSARWLAIPGLLLLHGFLAVTVRLPFIHLVLLATTLLFFDEELVRFLLRRRGESSSQIVGRRAVGAAGMVALAYVVTLVLTLVSDVPVTDGLGRGARVFLSDVGLAPSHRWYDAQGLLIAKWKDVVSIQRGEASQKLVDATQLWLTGLRSVRLRAFLAQADEQLAPPEAELRANMRKRLAARFCRSRQNGAVTAALETTAAAPGAHDTSSKIILARFSCGLDGSAQLLSEDPSLDMLPSLAALAARQSLEVPQQHLQNAFAGSDVCLACHATLGEAWRASPHAHSLGAPTPTEVRGDFTAGPVAIPGGSVRPVSVSGALYVEMDDGKELSRQSVDWVLGAGSQVQVYLSRTNSGRFSVLPILWVTHKHQWRSATLYGSSSLSPQSRQFWEAQDAIAARCFECHTSGSSYRFDNAQVAVAWREPVVSCEACHGPAKAHARAEQKGRREPLMQRKGTSSSEYELAICRQCHSAATPFAALDGPWPPERYDASLASSITRADGTAFGLAYESSQLALSECYIKGKATCSSCHDVHGLSTKGSEACGACHAELVAEGAKRRHSRHRAASCVDCHMPRLAQLDSEVSGRSATNHTIAIPRPRESVELGIPNACNNCHADKPATWAVDAVTAWGQKKALEARPWVSLLARSRRGEKNIAPALAELATSELPAEIVVAALRALSSQPPDPTIASIVSPLAGHTEPVVRAAALGALAHHDAAKWQDWKRRGARDPNPFVRIMAFEAERDGSSLSAESQARYLADVLNAATVPLAGPLLLLAQVKMRQGDRMGAQQLLELAGRIATPTEAARWGLSSKLSRLR